MDVFVARQPIFDTNDAVVGYELLHRASAVNRFSGVEGRLATGQLLVETLMGENWLELTSGTPAWVNFPEELLLDGSATLIAPQSIVVEILEDVRGDPAVVEACRELRAAGYRLAADDVVDADDPNPLLDLADIIKVDFRHAPPTARAQLARRFRGKTLLAEKVETRAERQIAVNLGYDLLQGHYLHEPTVYSRQTIDRSRFGLLAVLDAVHAEPMDFARVERSLKSEVALTDKLLRYLNSAAFAWRREVTSLRAALVALGEVQVRRWVAVVALSTVSADKPGEILLSALVRSQMCEQLAPHLAGRATGLDLFLTGLYSRMHVLIDAPREETLQRAPLPVHIRTALLERTGVLWEALELVRMWEAADWPGVERAAAALGIEVGDLSRSYRKAVQFAETVQELGTAA